MAEIKSTLDLVMERTRHLTLSSEEKEAGNQEAFHQKIRGLVQKFQDQRIRTEEFGKELERIQQDHEITEPAPVIGEITARIQPETDNEPLLELLQNVMGADTEGIRGLLRDFSASLEDLKNTRMEAVRRTLADPYRISGSAVIPNLQNDAEWLLNSKRLREDFQKRLKDLQPDVRI